MSKTAVAAALEAIKNPPRSSSVKTPTTYIEKYRAKFGLKGKDCWENTSLGRTIQFGAGVEITEEMIVQLFDDGFTQNALKPQQFFPKGQGPEAEAEKEAAALAEAEKEAKKEAKALAKAEKAKK